MRLLPLFGISIAFHFYVGLRLVPPLPGAGWSALLAMLLLVSALLMPVGLLARRISQQSIADRLTWAGMLFMGLFSSLFVFTLARDVLLMLTWVIGHLTVLPIQRVRAVTAQAVPVLAVLATLWGLVNARRTAGVVTVDVPIKGLPHALAGYTIVQISDVHVGPTIKQRYVQDIVAAVNALKPDMVAVTGDLVDGSVADLAGHVAPLSTLVSRDGTFFVTGNHEYYSGAHAWVVELRRLGLTVLMNQHVVIEREGAQLVLAGVADFGAHHFDPEHRSDPRAALAGAPMRAVKVLLAHQPRTAKAAREAGFDLQLSGHTHGGQFWPWNFMVRFQQPFTAGLHRMGRLWVYVSRGTGYWGPPKRLFAPSEITRLRLVATI